MEYLTHIRFFIIDKEETWGTFEVKGFVVDITVDAVSAKRGEFTFTTDDQDTTIPTATAPLIF